METLFKKEKLPGFAIVTGSSRGLGANFAYRLANDGYDVLINYSSDASEADALEVKGQIERDTGRRALICKADVSVPEECTRMVETACDTFGSHAAVLINNAGIHRGGNFEDIPPETYSKIIYVDLIGCLNMCRASIPHMLEAGEGAIINISSSAAYAQSYKNEAYGTAKAALLGLTKCLALEFAGKGIRANAIAPCQHATKMVEDFARNDPENFKKSCAAIPLGRIGRPDELSEAMSYLVHARFMTGHCIAHSGGKVLLC